MRRFWNWVACWLAAAIGVFASAAALPLPAEQPLSSRMDDLGFDRLLLVQRHPVEASHPYTFFYMDYRQGGGLFVYDLKTGELTKNRRFDGRRDSHGRSGFRCPPDRVCLASRRFSPQRAKGISAGQARPGANLYGQRGRQRLAAGDGRGRISISIRAGCPMAASRSSRRAATNGCTAIPVRSVCCIGWIPTARTSSACPPMC